MALHYLVVMVTIAWSNTNKSNSSLSHLLDALTHSPVTHGNSKGACIMASLSTRIKGSKVTVMSKSHSDELHNKRWGGGVLS